MANPQKAFHLLHTKSQRAKKLMRAGETSGNWHKTKRAATLLDGRLSQIEKLKQGKI